jgi:hypothetical protein
MAIASFSNVIVESSETERMQKPWIRLSRVTIGLPNITYSDDAK